jgi:hypothetical protein
MPLIALAIQWLRLPGKRGKARKQVANIKRLPGETALEVEIQPLIVEKDFGKGSRATVTPIVDPKFDQRKYRRALHHVAFNVRAYERGGDYMLRPQFDEARRYIRRPHSDEEWLFVQTVLPLGQIRPIVQGRFVTGGAGETVHLRLFNLDLYVDLLNRGGLIPWALKNIGPTAEPVVPGASEAGLRPTPGEKRYRLRLE